MGIEPASVGGLGSAAPARLSGGPKICKRPLLDTPICFPTRPRDPPGAPGRQPPGPGWGSGHFPALFSTPGRAAAGACLGARAPPFSPWLPPEAVVGVPGIWNLQLGWGVFRSLYSLSVCLLYCMRALSGNGASADFYHFPGLNPGPLTSGNLLHPLGHSGSGGVRVLHRATSRLVSSVLTVTCLASTLPTWLTSCWQGRGHHAGDRWLGQTPAEETHHCLHVGQHPLDVGMSGLHRGLSPSRPETVTATRPPPRPRDLTGHYFICSLLSGFRPKAVRPRPSAPGTALTLSHV